MRKWRQLVLTGVLRILVLRGSGEIGGWEDAAFFFFLLRAEETKSIDQ